MNEQLIGMVPDLWVVEFSRSQGAFMVQKMSQAAEENLRMFLASETCDYAIVAVAATRADANRIFELLNSRPDRSFEFGFEEQREMLENLGRLGVNRFVPIDAEK